MSHPAAIGPQKIATSSHDLGWPMIGGRIFRR
jgi:hypothetical protein